MTSKYPMQPLVVDKYGSHRFEANPIIDHLFDTGKLDLNYIAVWCQQNNIDNKYQEQLAQLLGYSIGGYSELSYVSDKSFNRAVKLSEKLNHDNRT